MNKHYIFFIKSNINKNRLHVFIVSKDSLNNHFFINFYDKKNIINMPIVLSSEQFDELKNKYEYIEVEKKEVKFVKSKIMVINCIGLCKMYLGINNRRIINENDLRNYLLFNKIPTLFQSYKTFIKEFLWVVK
jgi:hypothetical protein